MPIDVSDDAFLNKVQKGIALWKTKIRSLASLDHDVSSGTCLQEINFWLSVERSVNGVSSQLRSPSIGKNRFSPFKLDTASI